MVRWPRRTRFAAQRFRTYFLLTIAQRYNNKKINSQSKRQKSSGILRLSVRRILFMKASFPARGFCVGMVLCAGVLLSHAAQQPQKIAILPLTAGGQEDINYITEGLRDMIASRISSGAGLAVIEQAAVKRQYAGGGREAPSPEKVRSTGKALGADYVIFGSVAKMGDDLLIAINMLSVAKGGAPLPVFSQTLGLNEVIPRLQLIAQEVRGAIEDGVLAPEEHVPSAESRNGTERSQPAEAPTAGRVGPDPLMERDQAATPELPVDDSGGMKAGETPPAPEEAEAVGATEEAVDEQAEGEGGLKHLLFKRKGDIKAPPENPSYEKSADELRNAAEPQP
jgi:TolB-like protein